MLVGILSDSHIQDEHTKEQSYLSLLKKLQQVFNEVDHIIHAGDICTKIFLSDLERIAPISYVRGNTDFRNKTWPRLLRLNFEKISIGVAHQLENLASFDPNPRIFIYGHTHIAKLQEIEGGTLTINPGSITRPRSYSFVANSKVPRPTVAFLTIEDGIISAIIKKI